MQEPPSTWLHPWLKIERVLRGVLAVEMASGASQALDEALALTVEKRREIKRAGWFN